ncbi:MAG: C4-dicarboxylate ABC transporter substrate-binding protein [Gammaproteobacteria bacterium]|nr:C4-dicarboxylate ABC transporter substrate-binding protein [Gammaproteobacteria bacterium]
MKKTLLFASAAGLALGLSTAVTPVAVSAATVDGPSVNWKLSVWGKRRSFTEGVEYISSELEKRTGGKFNLKIFYGDQLSKSKENLDGISIGAFEAAVFCASYHPGKNAPLNVLDLPFLPLADFDIMRKAHDAVYNHPASQKALAKWNAHLYMSNILPQYEYMGRGDVPKSVADFKGKRLRALGGMGRAAKLIGATPSTMPASETYTALQRGTVDAIGFPYSYTFSAYKLEEVADWVTTNMKLGTVNCPTVFNTDAYAALPAQYKQLLEDLKPGAYAAMAADYQKKDEQNEAKWSGADSRIKMIRIPDNEMAEFRKLAGRPVWDQWVKDNEGELPAQELLDLVLKAAGQ